MIEGHFLSLHAKLYFVSVDIQNRCLMPQLLEYIFLVIVMHGDKFVPTLISKTNAQICRSLLSGSDWIHCVPGVVLLFFDLLLNQVAATQLWRLIILTFWITFNILMSVQQIFKLLKRILLISLATFHIFTTRFLTAVFGSRKSFIFVRVVF